jgi:hypothetical protein
MKTLKRNQTKPKTTEKNNFLDTLSNAINETGDIDNIIETVNLKKGRSSFAIFVAENFKKEKSKDNNIKLGSVMKKSSEKWSKLGKNEKEKYEKISEEEKEKYKQDLKIIKHYFFSDYSKYGSSAYKIFLNERLKIGFEKDEDIKTTKKKAFEEWNNMSSEEKKEWKKKKKENDTWWEKSKNLRNITAYAVFIQKCFEESKEKKEELPKLKALSKIWSLLSNKEKNKYYDYANEINEERRKRRDLFEIVNGIRPKRPAGAYKIFLTEKAKEGFFKGKINVYKEGRKLWENLSEDDKKLYLKKAKKIKLCYIYRKLLYKKNIKNLLPKKPPSAFNCFVTSLKGTNLPDGKKFLELAKEKWANVSDKEKEKFEEIAEKEKKKYEKKMKDFENKIFDEPKKPKSAFILFLMEKINDNKNVNKNLTLAESVQEFGKEWKELNEKKKEIFNKRSEKDKKRFKAQMKEFKEKGFYSNKRNTLNNTQSSYRSSQRTLSEKKRSQRKEKSKSKSQRKSCKK